MKKQIHWTPHNAVLLPLFITEAVILHWESDTGELLKIFDRSITEWTKEGETTSGDDDDKDSEGGVKVEVKRRRRKVRQIMPPPRRWTPLKKIVTTS